MDNTIFERINKYFLELDYEKIPTDSDTVNMYATYQKSSLYLINVIDLELQYGIDIEKYKQYKELTKNQFKNFRADKIILLNLMLIDNPSRIYEKINFMPELDDSFIDIHWIIDTNKGELVIPRKQIKNVIGLEKDIESLLGSKEISRVKLEKKEGLPVVTGALIVINCAVWVALELTGGSTDINNIMNFGAMYAPNIINQNEYWRLFTCNFIHIGASHLMFNMISLYIFGFRLEKYLTKLQYLTIYLLSGIVGATVSLLSDLILKNYAVSAGASGAIYGIIGSIIISSRLARKAIDGLNAYIMGIFFILGMAFSVVSPNVDASAHLGGFFGGMLITYILLIGSKSEATASVSE